MRVSVVRRLVSFAMGVGALIMRWKLPAGISQLLRAIVCEMSFRIEVAGRGYGERVFLSSVLTTEFLESGGVSRMCRVGMPFPPIPDTLTC